MDLTGEERIALPRDAVWAALNDPEVLKQCIYGCQSLDWISPTQLSATVKVKLGLISPSFTGTITLSRMNPPHSYTIFGEGKGGIAGVAKGSADVALEDDGDDTVLRYAIHTEVGGKLAQFGSMLVTSSANRIAAKFFSDFSAAARAKAQAEAG